MTFQSGTGFTEVSTDSGNATITNTKPNLDIVGTGDATTSASGNIITVDSTPNGNTSINKIILQDDFIGKQKFDYITGLSSFNPSGSDSADHPGVVRYTVPGTGSSGLATEDAGMVLSGGEVEFTTIFKINALASGGDYTLRIGMGSSLSSGSIADGLLFKYSDTINSGNWQIIERSGAVDITTANTNTTVDTNWHVYKIIVNAVGNQASFFIDGSEVTGSPISVTIGSFLGFSMSAVTSSSSSQTIDVDLWQFVKELTNPRV